MALAFSGDGTILAGSYRRDTVRRTSVWRFGAAGDAAEAIAEHQTGSAWLQVLGRDARLLVGGVIVGPTPEASHVPLRVGAAATVDSSGTYLLGANAEGKALVCYLPELLRQVVRAGEAGVVQ